MPVPTRGTSPICPPGIRAATSTTCTPPSPTRSCGYATPSLKPSARTAATATRSTSSSTSPKNVDGYTCASATPKPIPFGRTRSEAVTRCTSPLFATSSVFTSAPSW